MEILQVNACQIMPNFGQKFKNDNSFSTFLFMTHFHDQFLGTISHYFRYL